MMYFKLNGTKQLAKSRKFVQSNVFQYVLNKRQRLWFSNFEVLDECELCLMTKITGIYILTESMGVDRFIEIVIA